MNNDVEYEIYIGCKDQHLKEDIIKCNELMEIVNAYFDKKKINFSMQEVEGGYLHLDGVFAFEKTLYITIIGKQDFDIVRFSKSLSMFMNQECFMVTKKDLLTDYR